MTVSFQPQPYPLYAVTIERAEEPLRFRPTEDPVRLVIGWRVDEQGEPTPVLGGGGPSGVTWTGPVFYEETRDRAERLVKEVAKGDRAAIREARWKEAIAWMDRKLGQ